MIIVTLGRKLEFIGENVIAGPVKDCAFILVLFFRNSMPMSENIDLFFINRDFFDVIDWSLPFIQTGREDSRRDVVRIHIEVGYRSLFYFGDPAIQTVGPDCPERPACLQVGDYCILLTFF